MFDNKHKRIPDVNIDDAVFMIVDLETTGINPEEDKVIEMSFRMIDPSLKSDVCLTKLIDPQMHIPSNSSAVHHIIDADVQGAPFFEEVVQSVYPAILKRRDNIFMVSHNVAFDREFLHDVDVQMPNGSTQRASIRDLPWLCTLRLAKHIYSDTVPSCSNQALRYELDFSEVGIDIPRDLNPHRAEDDTLVTAAILKHEIARFKALGQGDKLSDLIQYADSAYSITYMPFGKYYPKGDDNDMTIEEIAIKDPSYLDWVLKNTDPDFDMKWNIERALGFARGEKNTPKP